MEDREIYGLWYDLAVPALLSLLPCCNPVQVVLSILSVSAALSSLQACVNHQPVSLSLSLPLCCYQDTDPAHPSPFHFLFFPPRQLLCSFIISLHLEPIPPHSSHAIFWWATHPFYHFYILANSILCLPSPPLLSMGAGCIFFFSPICFFFFPFSVCRCTTPALISLLSVIASDLIRLSFCSNRCLHLHTISNHFQICRNTFLLCSIFGGAFQQQLWDVNVQFMFGDD